MVLYIIIMMIIWVINYEFKEKLLYEQYTEGCQKQTLPYVSYIIPSAAERRGTPVLFGKVSCTKNLPLGEYIYITVLAKDEKVKIQC